jgi:hypothetical protein
MASNTFVKSMEGHILNFIFNGIGITFGTAGNNADTNRSIGLVYLNAPTQAWDEYGSLYPSSAVTSTQYTNAPADNVIYEPLQGGTNDTGYARQPISFGTATTADGTPAGTTTTPRSLANNAEVTFPVCAGANYFAAAAIPSGTYAQSDGSNGYVSGWAVFAYNDGAITSTATINSQAYPIITGLFTTQKAILVDDQAKIAANNLTITLD